MHKVRRLGALGLLLTTLALAAAQAIPAAADHAPPPGPIVAGTGSVEGTESVLDETYTGAACFIATRSVFTLRGVGAYHGRTAGGQEVVYRAQVNEGEPLYQSGPLHVEVENTATYYHGPLGTHGTTGGCGSAGGDPVPAEFRVFAPDHVYRLDGTGAQVPCTGQGSFARGNMNDGQNWHADWSLADNCTVVGNEAGTPGSGTAAAGTAHTHHGVHSPCTNICQNNIRFDYAQYLPVQGLAVHTTGPASATTGTPVAVTARVTRDGNAVPNAAVTFSVTGPAPGAPPGGVAVTGADGRASFTFTAPVAGDYTVSASVTNAGDTASGTHVVRFIPPPPPTMALDGPTKRQTEEGVTVTATFTNAGNPVPGTTVNFAVAGPGQATPASGSALTNNNGKAAFTFAADRLGDYIVTASATLAGEEASATHGVHLDINTLHRVDGIDLPAGEAVLRSAVIDPDGTYAYFGASNTGQVVKVDLGTFLRVGAITLSSSGLSSAVIDSVGDYAYFGAYEKVIKVDLATFQEVGAITLNTGEANLESAVVDPAGRYAYFGTAANGAVGRVVKIDLATFQRVDAVTFLAGETTLDSAVMDPAGHYAYFGAKGEGTAPGRVVKVDLASFQRVGAVALHGSEENWLTSAAIEPSGDSAYFGTRTTPGRVVKIDLNAFQRVGAITLGAAEGDLYSAVMDPAGKYAYFGTAYAIVPERVIKVDLATFERLHAITLATTENNLFSAVMDPAGRYAYFGGGDEGSTTAPSPINVVKVAVSRAPKVALAAGDDAYSTDYATPLSVAAPGVLANDADTADGDPLTAGQASDPAGGSVALNPNGSFTYTPNAGFSGTDTFTYTASDAMDYSAPATVSVAVAAAPNGVASVRGGAFGYATSVSLFGGPASPRGPAPSVSLPPAGGDLSATDPDGATATYGPARIFENHGPLTVSTSGTTGPGGFVTSSASVDDISDNDPFHAHAPDGRVSSTCTATESGLAGSARIVGGRLVVHTDPTEGTPTEEITFPSTWDPAPNTTYEGGLDHIGDNWRIVFNEHVVGPDSITVNAVHLYLLGPTAVGDMVIGQSRCGVESPAANAAPVAGDDAYTASSGRALVVPAAGVLANDTDPESQALSATTMAPIPPPASGGGAWTFPSDPAHGSLRLGTDGSFTYIPDAGYTGPDAFTYVVADARGRTDTATVALTVAAALRKAVADFDGDNDTDRSVFRNGAWYAEGQPTAFFGVAGDVAVPGDYDGDGDADHAVYRQGAWLTEGQAPAYLGLATDVPVPADYDGDGDTDRAVFRPSVGAWYIEGQPTIYHGAQGDIAVPGDYNGDGDAEVGIWRPAVGGWYIAGQATEFLGLDGDVPVPGDYDGDGTADRGIWRPSVGGWYIAGQAAQFVGLQGDVAVPGDYDGDGDTDRGIWRPSVGGWYVDGQAPAYLGAVGDTPLPLAAAIHRAFF